jgi:hypothetical protein
MKARFFPLLVRLAPFVVGAGLLPLAHGQWAKAGFSGALMNPACFSPKDSARDDFGLRINGPADQSERAWLPSVLGRVAFLAGGNANHLVGNVKVNIHQGGKSWGSPCASYTSSANSVELVTKCRQGSNAQSVASHFAHELGHIVGLRGYYASYQRSMPVCPVTHYCTANHNHNPRNEEFAEVFATYLHSPNYLRSACPAQFEWMKKNVFPNGPDPTGTCTGNPNPNFSAPEPDEDQSFGPSTSLSKTGTVNSQMMGFAPLMQQLIQLMAQRSSPAPQPPLPIPYPTQQVPVQPQATPVVPVNPWPEGAH